LSEEKSMIMLTNKSINNKKDVHRTVRALKAMNTLNMLLMMQIGHIGMLVGKVKKKLLVIKMI